MGSPVYRAKLSAIIAELHRQNTSLFASMKALTLDPPDQCVAERARP